MGFAGCGALAGLWGASVGGAVVSTGAGVAVVLGLRINVLCLAGCASATSATWATTALSAAARFVRGAYLRSVFRGVASVCGSLAATGAVTALGSSGWETCGGCSKRRPLLQQALCGCARSDLGLGAGSVTGSTAAYLCHFKATFA